MIYGKTMQNGIPTPEKPIEIKGLYIGRIDELRGVSMMYIDKEFYIDIINYTLRHCNVLIIKDIEIGQHIVIVTYIDKDNKDVCEMRSSLKFFRNKKNN